MTESFINKYRPQSFGEVMGHTEILSALQRVLQGEDRPHCYLLVGPSGVGKTTIARLIGNYLGAEIQDIDAASHSGVEDMREIVELSQYMALTGEGNRIYIIDECHALSRNAWQALLKLTEEPPSHFYVALCTTEPSKVPATIAGQRAYQVQLKPLPPQTIDEFLQVICEIEQWSVNNDVFTAIVQGAEGSPRKALMLLLTLHDVMDREEVRRVLSRLDAESATVIPLAQLLLRGRPIAWPSIKPLLAALDADDEFEEAFVSMGRYLVACLLRTDKPATAAYINEMLNALTFPSSTFDPKVRFYAAIGRIIWPS